MIIVLWTVAALPWLMWSNTIPYDSKDEFYPGVVFAAKSLLRGETPFWNPFLYAGYPSFADPQAMTFSPSIALPMLVSQSIAWFDVIVLLHLLLGGIGMLRLGRSYGWTSGASMISAMVFMFGGVASSRLQHTPIIVTWAFLPWMLVAIRALFAKPTWRPVVGSGLAIGLGALQLTQVTYLALLLVAAYAICRLGETVFSVGWREARATAVGLAVAAALSLLIVTPQLAATLQVLPYTIRANMNFGVATANSLSPVAYVTLIAPNALGSLIGEYVGPNDITETYLYLGSFPLAILLLGLVGRKQRWARIEAVFWTLAIAFSVLYALGSATPIYAWLFEYLPGVQYFRRPTDAAFLLVFAAAVMIGASISPPREGAETDRWETVLLWAFAAIGCLLLVATISISMWFGTRVSRLSLAALSLGIVCYVGARRSKRPGIWIALLVGSVFVDLRNHTLGNRLNALPAAVYLSGTSLEHNAALRYVAQRLREDGPYRIELHTHLTELNAPASLSIASIGGLNPFTSTDYITFVGMQSDPMGPRQPSGTFDSYHGKINDLLGVRYLVADAGARTSFESELGAAYEVVLELQGRVIWQNRNALPRVLRPEHVIPAPQLSAFKPAMLNSIDLEKYAYVDAPIDVLAKCAGGRAKSARISVYSNDVVVVDVQTDDAAWITLNDGYFVGWRAKISDETLPIYRANGIFRAVCVPPGRHSVRFLFQPFRHYLQTLWTAVVR